MQKKMQVIIFFLIIIMSLSPVMVFADENQEEPEQGIILNATAAILVEQTTGQVLFGYNEHERRYPASMTKMLTALVVLDHFDPDEIIVVGPEIQNMPTNYATNIHVEDEHITVRMLLKALMIRSGNETGRTLALNVIRRTQNNPDISYEEAKILFSNLMNQRAYDLGATSSNFDNPYGLHSDQHYTTAYDLALIARAYMEVPLLAEIAGLHSFESSGTEGRYIPDALIRDYSWINHNLTLPEATFGHPHMTGIKTGFTTPAGECLAGAASFGDMALITIVFDSESPGRWNDTWRLMNYGFFNYSFREIAQEGELLEYVRIINPRRGETDVFAIHASESHTALISHDDYANLTRVITYNLLLTPPVRRQSDDDESDEEEDGRTILQAPIEEGDFIGTVAYFVGEEIIFESRLYAAEGVLERSFDSDMDYFISRVTDNIFTVRGLPYWLAIGGTVLGFVGMGWALSLRRKLKEHDRWHTPRPRSKKN
ncbi:MAG: D-alanyl-D-alanine carboxypeptidase [Defluviitaleaceae bacterium]|nr:D-alanyl-D-alanine carboxypeptidase [Defluviitaleaceae bacterium]